MSDRSYHQYCGLARALDVVGDRWALLIVRELLLGPARYGELVDGLPGIATNLLAARLRALEAAGVVERRLGQGRTGVAYALTDWGAQLREVVDGLIRWSTPLMAPGPGSDAFRPRWFVGAVRALLRDQRSDPPATVGFQLDDALLVLRVDDIGPHLFLDPPSRPTTVLATRPEIVLGLATGTLNPVDILAGAALEGSPDPLIRIFRPTRK